MAWYFHGLLYHELHTILVSSLHVERIADQVSHYFIKDTDPVWKNKEPCDLVIYAIGIHLKLQICRQDWVKYYSVEKIL